MTREDVFTLIRDHLADELDLDAGADRRGARASRRTSRPTRSTSTRWCRSSRTPTACKMSDEQAAQILTVGQAVDFVLAHAPSAT